jgi:hypothetical protein
MKAYQMLKSTGAATRDERKFRLPYAILFGKGLNGDYAKVAGGRTAGDRETRGEATWSTK